jgi:hypothetical protein
VYLEGAPCPGNRRVKFYINCRLEYVYVEGGSCPGNRSVKFYINGNFGIYLVRRGFMPLELEGQILYKF